MATSMRLTRSAHRDEFGAHILQLELPRDVFVTQADAFAMDGAECIGGIAKKASYPNG